MLILGSGSLAFRSTSRQNSPDSIADSTFSQQESREGGSRIQRHRCPAPAAKQEPYRGKVPDQNRVAETGKSAYLLGRTNTFAVGAKSSSVPPTISGPRGVKAIPRLSARASGVSSQSVSHRLPCTSKVKVRGEMSIGFPSAVTFLKLCGAVVPPEK